MFKRLFLALVILAFVFNYCYAVTPVTITNPDGSSGVTITDGKLETTSICSDITIGTETNSGAIKTAVETIATNLPAKGQALAAASLPVVLTAAQITTLTPPAAITGFATAAKQPALGIAGTASTDVITVQGIGSMTPILATVTGTATITPAAFTPVVKTTDSQVKGTAGTVYAIMVTGIGVTAGDMVQLKNSADNSGTALITIVADAANGTWAFYPSVGATFSTAIYYDVTVTGGGVFTTTIIYN